MDSTGSDLQDLPKAKFPPNPATRESAAQAKTVCFN
jgi:hypothetical protein